MACPRCGADAPGAAAGGTCAYCGGPLPSPPPAPLEGLLADRDGDGIPDVFGKGGVPGMVVGSVTYRINGVVYKSLDEMPPDVRGRIEPLLKRAAAPALGATGRADVRVTTISGKKGCSTALAIVALAAAAAALRLLLR